MKELASLDLKVCTGCGQPNEQRIELRLISTGDFVAWFQANERINGKVRTTATNTQIVYRKELSSMQITAIKEWLQAQLSAAL